jgi:hypothetical protein
VGGGGGFFVLAFFVQELAGDDQFLFFKGQEGV